MALTPDERQRRERFVLEWQQPIYAYVRRMVRGDDEAQDITQDTFTRALRHIDRIPAGEIRPWLYRVATNAVHDAARARRRRHEREKRFASMSREISAGEERLGPEETAEVEEAREVVRHHLGELPADQRALLLLHYFGGLSHHDVSRALDLPRSTVSSRIRSALDRLGGALERAGHAALIPGLPTFLAPGAPPAIPAELTQSLLSLAAGTATTSATLSIGGIVVTQKILLGVVALAVGCLIGSFALPYHSRTGKPGESARAEDGVPLASVLRDLEAAKSRVESLEDQLAAAQADRQRALDELAQLEQSSEESMAGRAVPASSALLGEGGAAGIDWGRLARITRENRDVLIALSEAIADDRGPSALSPELQARHRALIAELDKVAAMARVDTPYPMLDPEILPNIVDVYLGALLDLDERQGERARELALDLRRQFEVPEDATPLMAHPVRMELLRELGEGLGDYLTPNQRETWQKLEPLWSSVVQGSFGRVEVGLRTGDGRHQVDDHLRDHYRLDDEQRRQASPIIERYLADARSLLDEYGQVGDRRRTLTAEETEALDRAQYDLQREMERGVMALMTEQQRADLSSQRPVHFRFSDSGNITVNMSDNSGF
ncbi:MAG: sigma-70 family RNA polymerase sigma factor [Planctomycetes bacterium]|nr:sigma-70 family RNA polymerase sigma factor [Planctomycetota bacterium]